MLGVVKEVTKALIIDQRYKDGESVEGPFLPKRESGTGVQKYT